MLTGSGPVVSAVLYTLIAASVASWGIVIFKARQLHAARKGAEEFQKLFWDTRNLAEVSRACAQLGPNPLAAVFTAGYEELLRLRTKKKAAAEEGFSTELAGVANVERAMRRAAMRERVELEKLLTFLATCSSTAPFIGLFGTVWGIMNSFVGLSAGGPSSITAVAPGISEALIATAAGLAAAIPAVIAYNFFLARIRVLTTEMEAFSSDFLNIVKRHFFR
jgi:biopolymer transport protein TolQ